MQNSITPKGGIRTTLVLIQKNDLRSGARAAESGSLLRSCARKGTGGSNPPCSDNGILKYQKIPNLWGKVTGYRNVGGFETPRSCKNSKAKALLKKNPAHGRAGERGGACTAD